MALPTGARSCCGSARSKGKKDAWYLMTQHGPGLALLGAIHAEWSNTIPTKLTELRSEKIEVGEGGRDMCMNEFRSVGWLRLCSDMKARSGVGYDTHDRPACAVRGCNFAELRKWEEHEGALRRGLVLTAQLKTGGWSDPYIEHSNFMHPA